ncbi:DUF3492 domain-containing protein, partial [Streptomyces sp. NPDC059015]|uniref:DUF3492 domain-containing protein n=1 Tax=Streptomyces sp. NPDC059015 TaxID=3346698 RepID=UPI0036804458
MSQGRHVTMLTEGTYPHVHGGVSTWCDQLVRGMPEVDFTVVSLTGSGREPVTWELPPNVRAHSAVPLWGPRPGRGRSPRPGADRSRFVVTRERFRLALVSTVAHGEVGAGGGAGAPPPA